MDPWTCKFCCCCWRWLSAESIWSHGTNSGFWNCAIQHRWVKPPVLLQVHCLYHSTVLSQKCDVLDEYGILLKAQLYLKKKKNPSFLYKYLYSINCVCHIERILFKYILALQCLWKTKQTIDSTQIMFSPGSDLIKPSKETIRIFHLSSRFITFCSAWYPLGTVKLSTYCL